MPRFALAAAVILALSGTAAMAADLPVSVAAGPPPPWPRTWDWNGFYGGINAGFSFGRARDTWNIPTLSVTGEDAEKFTTRRGFITQAAFAGVLPGSTLIPAGSGTV